MLPWVRLWQVLHKHLQHSHDQLRVSPTVQHLATMLGATNWAHGTLFENGLLEWVYEGDKEAYAGGPPTRLLGSWRLEFYPAVANTDLRPLVPQGQVRQRVVGVRAVFMERRS
jgi:hypothetical protein